MFRAISLLIALALVPVTILLAEPSVTDEAAGDPLTLVVMDPLCDRLACDCVEGYAQRKYEALAEYLSDHLNRQVDIVWGESIHAALEESSARADIVVGKHSVVVSDAESLGFDLQPVGRLTGRDGSVDQTGLIVVRQNDPAQTVADLTGYRIFFGPANCDEKYAAPMQLLDEHGIDLPEKPEIAGACSEAATWLVELDEGVKAAAVISSYAEPLLSGCGTIQEGELRVVGTSKEVPFVTAFVHAELPEQLRNEITAALLKSGEHPSLMESLETAGGFLAFDLPTATGPARSADTSASTKKK